MLSLVYQTSLWLMYTKYAPGFVFASEDMCLFRVRVRRNMSIGVGCLLSILCGRLGSARILNDLSCLFLWLILRTSGFYDGFGLGRNSLRRSLLATLFVGGIVCLCCVPNPLIERRTSVFRDWVFRSSCIWVSLHLP